MQDLRFKRENNFGDDRRVEQEVLPQKREMKVTSKRVLKVLAGLILLGALFFFAPAVWDRIDGQNDPNQYSAVFLTNDQVYFGKVVKNSKREMVLKDVYYLQVAGAGVPGEGLAGSSFTIVKLGDELHGPTDELFINRAHILFYETLRDDSKVVESIRNK